MPRINWNNVNTGDVPYVAQCFTSTYPSGTFRDYHAHIRWPTEVDGTEGWLRQKATLPRPSTQFAAMQSLGLSLGNDGSSLRNDTGHHATEAQITAFAAANGLAVSTVS